MPPACTVSARRFRIDRRANGSARAAILRVFLKACADRPANVARALAHSVNARPTPPTSAWARIRAARVATASAIARVSGHIGACSFAEVLWLAGASAILADRQLAAEWRTGVVFVDNPVAIIVHAIALLRDAGVNSSIAIVAVAAAADLGAVTVDILVE